MQIFYAPDIGGQSYTFDETESKHIVRVLRMGKGNSIQLIDGKGRLFEGIITDPDPKRCTIDILSINSDFEKRQYKLHMAISLLKNSDRFEWFIEKSVEIGVDEITPLICNNTEKKTLKEERTEKLIISAMKQSLKAYLTVLNKPLLFSDFIETSRNGSLIIAHCNSDISRNSISGIYKKGENATLLIGPEGDFTPEEVKAAILNGYKSVHLGNSRLRTETAGIAACHSIYFLNQ